MRRRVPAAETRVRVDQKRQALVRNDHIAIQIAGVGHRPGNPLRQRHQCVVLHRFGAVRLHEAAVVLKDLGVHIPVYLRAEEAP